MHFQNKFKKKTPKQPKPNQKYLKEQYAMFLYKNLNLIINRWRFLSLFTFSYSLAVSSNCSVYTLCFGTLLFVGLGKRAGTYLQCTSEQASQKHFMELSRNAWAFFTSEYNLLQTLAKASRILSVLLFFLVRINGR